MYAIRSYYGIDKDGVINASFENDSVSEIFTEVTYQNGLYAFLNDNANFVITSYSIHYTKLYDSHQ